MVDTNVAIVANGRNSNAALKCRAAFIDALARILESGRIIIDIGGEMLAEYRTYCSPHGQPGIGDRFFREVLMNYSGKVVRIELSKRADGSFVDFPADPDLAGFDPSDKKFAAAARKSNTPVLNSTDSDWLDHRAALERNGVTVEFVCGTVSGKWLTVI